MSNEPSLSPARPLSLSTRKPPSKMHPSRARPSRHHGPHDSSRQRLPHWPIIAAASTRQRRPAPLLVAASAAPSSSTAPSSLDEATTPNHHHQKIRIRLAHPKDYWEASDLHCASFFEQETAHQRTRRLNQSGLPPGPPLSPLGALAARDPRWMPVALRVDRCVSLQLNDDLQRRGVGRTALLLAEMDVEDGDEAIATPTPTTPTTATNPLAFPRPLFFLSPLLEPSVRAGLDAALNASQTNKTTTILVGAATVDSFGDLVPPKQLDPGRDGAFGWMPRHGGDRNHYAYLSNVAVAPIVRRRGVAKRLVRAAEGLAAGLGPEDLDLGLGEGGEEREDDGDNPKPPAWACGAAALHCSPENEAALRLYGSMGYRRVALEPAWAPYLNGRGAGGRCYLMVRRLPTRREKETTSDEETMML